MSKAPKYEGSPADNREDKRLAKKAGMSESKFEKSGKDKKFDLAGQKRFNARRSGRGR